MKVRYRVVPKQNKKSSFYVNCHSQHVTIQAADSAFSTLLSLRERLSAWYKEKNISFYTTDFREMNLDFLGENDLIYCDPPYLISTGSYNDGNRGFKDWHEEEEEALLTLLDRLNDQGTRFALSNVLYHKGLSNDLLIDWSKKYHITCIDKSYANCNYHFKDRDAVTVEVLITNYVPEGMEE